MFETDPIDGTAPSMDSTPVFLTSILAPRNDLNVVFITLTTQNMSECPECSASQRCCERWPHSPYRIVPEP